MGKANLLLKAAGGSIAESAAHRGTPAAMPTATLGSTLGGDRLAGVGRIKGALEIPVAKIDRDPDQPREEFDDDALARLASSIKSRGVLQPLRVRFDEPAGVYRLIAGERRWRAAKLAGVATLPCIVEDRPLSPGELLAVMVTENALREDLKPIESAKAYRALMTLNGWSGNQLSKELGIAQSGVVQALAMLELPEQVQAVVDSGALTASSAYAISTLDDEATQVEVAALAVADKLSRSEVIEAVRQRAPKPKAAAKGRGASKPPKVVTRTLRTSNGTKLTAENRKGVDDETLAAALEEAAARIRAESGSGSTEAA